MISDIIFKVRQPLENEVNYFKENSTLLSLLYPAQNKDIVNKLAEKKINAFGKTVNFSTLFSLLEYFNCSYGLHSTYIESASI